MRRAIAFLVLLTACSGNAVAPTAAPGSSVTTTTSTDPGSRPTTTVETSPTTSSSTIADAPPVTEVPRRPDWFVVWVTGQMPDGFSDALRSQPGVGVVSEVWVGNASVVAVVDKGGSRLNGTKRGFFIPVELQAIEPSDHAEFVPDDVAAKLLDLAPGEVLLGASSADFRGVSVGATVELEDGAVLTVAGVVPDRWVGFAEMVTTSPDFRELGADRPRYDVVRFSGSSAELEEIATGLTDRAVRVWSESEVDVFRHADAVRPQIAVKQRFGEFAYRPLRGGRIEIDPDWVDANIVTTTLPLIGSVRCHRDFAALLEAAMERIAASPTPEVISPASNVGCFNQRFIAGRRDLSRHAWGIAMDINWGNDFDATRSPVAPVLLEAMAQVGITSGRAWISPDPGHFEWIGS